MARRGRDNPKTDDGSKKPSVRGASAPRVEPWASKPTMVRVASMAKGGHTWRVVYDVGSEFAAATALFDAVERSSGPGSLDWFEATLLVTRIVDPSNPKFRDFSEYLAAVLREPLRGDFSQE